MPKAQLITTNFTAGVFSPRLRGRVDLEKYSSSMQDGSNVVCLKQGGIKARPSLDFLGSIRDEAAQARLIPFVYSNTTSYTLEFGALFIRFRKNGTLLEASPGTPYELVTPFTVAELDALDYVQAGDTLILAHPAHPLIRIRRFGDTSWALDEAPLNPGPVAEIGARASIALTLSAASVGTGRTVTAGSSFFKAADVGRSLICVSGKATITAVASATSATATITAAFAGTTLAINTWKLEGSPLTTLTPSVKDPVGASVSLSCASPAIRTGDVGLYVEINSGLVRIDSVVPPLGTGNNTYDGDASQTTFAYTFQINSTSEIYVRVDGVAKTITTDYTVTGVGSPTGGNVVFLSAPPATAPANVELYRLATPEAITGTIICELSATTAAPADAWALLSPVWNSIDGYPSAVVLHEQRLWGANTASHPQSEWGSKSGLFFDFTPGPNDDDAVYKTIDSRQSNPIRYMHSGKAMMALTDSSEWEMRGGVEKPIAQSNFSAKRQSGWGCAQVKPEEVGDNVVFVQRGGKVLRAAYALDIDGFGARDISVFSDHLITAGVRALSLQQTPESVLWAVLNDGGLVAVTYSAEQNVIALTPCPTDGVVESICTVPEGTMDVTYIIVRRTFTAGARRYIERVNWTANPGMDSRLELTGASATTWGGFGHIAGKAAAVLADGISVGPLPVNSSGQIVLPYAASTVAAGLAYVPSVTLQRPEVGTGTGTAQAAAVSVHRMILRFLETAGCSVNGTAITWQQMGDDPLDGQIPIYTGDKEITDIGWDVDTVITQPQPYPWTLLAAIRDVTVNAG